MKMKIKKVDGKLEISKKGYKVTLSREVEDRDGEVIVVDGIDISNFKNNPVLIDAHNIGGSVVDNVLGKVLNIQKVRDEKGIPSLVGELDFAETPRAVIAKSLVDGGYVNTVSIGYKVRQFDSKTKGVIDSELYELSLVSVPANIYARIEKKGFEPFEIGSELTKRLKNYEDVKPVLKMYRKLFMSNKFFGALGVDKTGNEVKDIEAIYEKALELLLVHGENHHEKGGQEENPLEVAVTVEELAGLLKDLV